MPGKMARSDPRPSVRVTRGASSGQHLASVLQESQENAKINAGLGFICRISVQSIAGTYVLEVEKSQRRALRLNACVRNRYLENFLGRRSAGHQEQKNARGGTWPGAVGAR
jgi:hypothetical protein